MQNRKKNKQYAYGDSFFPRIVKEQQFLDKTLFIKNILKNSQPKLFVLPKGYGKTFNLFMLQYFFDPEKKADSHLFDNTKILKADKGSYQQFQNKHPVLFINLCSAFDEKLSESIDGFMHTVADTSRENFSNIKEKLPLEQQLYIHKIYKKSMAGLDEVKNILPTLIKYLFDYHQSKVLVLINDCDFSLEDIEEKDKQKTLDYFRSAFLFLFDNHPMILTTVLTGRSFSALQLCGENVQVYSRLSMGAFLEDFGVTAKEAEEQLELKKDDPILAKLVAFYGYPLEKNGDHYVETIGKMIENKLCYIDGLTKIVLSYLIDNAVLINPESYRLFYNNTLAKEELWKEYIFEHDREADLLQAMPKTISLEDSELIMSDVKKLISAKPLKKQINVLNPESQIHAFWANQMTNGYLAAECTFNKNEYVLRIPNREVNAVYQRWMIEYKSYKLSGFFKPATKKRILASKVKDAFRPCAKISAIRRH